MWLLGLRLGTPGYWRGGKRSLYEATSLFPGYCICTLQNDSYFRTSAGSAILEVTNQTAIRGHQISRCRLCRSAASASNDRFGSLRGGRTESLKRMRVSRSGLRGVVWSALDTPCARACELAFERIRARVREFLRYSIHHFGPMDLEYSWVMLKCFKSEQQVAESRELISNHQEHNARHRLRSKHEYIRPAKVATGTSQEKSPYSYQKPHSSGMWQSGYIQKQERGPPWCTSGPEKECRAGQKGLSEGASAYVSFLRATRRTSFFILFSSSSWMSFCVCARVQASTCL